MKNLDIDKILGAGLVLALILFLIGQFACILFDKTPLPMELGCAIVTGLIGYMSRKGDDKHDTNVS